MLSTIPMLYASHSLFPLSRTMMMMKKERRKKLKWYYILLHYRQSRYMLNSWAILSSFVSHRRSPTECPQRIWKYSIDWTANQSRWFNLRRKTIFVFLLPRLESGKRDNMSWPAPVRLNLKHGCYCSTYEIASESDSDKIQLIIIFDCAWKPAGRNDEYYRSYMKWKFDAFRAHRAHRGVSLNTGIYMSLIALCGDWKGEWERWNISGNLWIICPSRWCWYRATVFSLVDASVLHHPHKRDRTKHFYSLILTCFHFYCFLARVMKFCSLFFGCHK